MSSQQSTVDFIIEQMASAGEITSRKMFGEHCLYCDGKPVVLVCDDQLFLKPTNAGRAFLTEVIEKPPYPGAKNYLWISGEHWDDATWLGQLVKISAAELPPPKKKK